MNKKGKEIIIFGTIYIITSIALIILEIICSKWNYWDGPDLYDIKLDNYDVVLGIIFLPIYNLAFCIIALIAAFFLRKILVNLEIVIVTIVISLFLMYLLRGQQHQSFINILGFVLWEIVLVWLLKKNIRSLTK